MSRIRIAGPDLPEQLKQVVDYRKSGLSLNHVVGCPLDCGYCVRHLFDNFDMKKPHLVMPDEQAVDALISHWAFRAGTTPIQIFNRATDPFLPGVKDHLFACLEELDRRGFSNPVLVITRWHVLPDDVKRMNGLKNIKLTVLVTWSGIGDKRIEPVDSAIAEASIRTLALHAKRVRCILYWRPIIAGVNDSPDHLARAKELAGIAHATVFTGLFYREEIRSYFASVGVPDLYNDVARRKILPEQVETNILKAFDGTPIFRKTSCGVAYVHGVADYNGHFGIREICDICPLHQREICAAAHKTPSADVVERLAHAAGLDTATVSIDGRRVEVTGSVEQQRYFMQHTLNYQVHDRAQPHHYGRHGKADLGWT